MLPQVQLALKHLALAQRPPVDSLRTIANAQRGLTEEQKAASAFTFFMMVGQCPACDADYYVAMASFMSGNYDDVEGYLNLNIEPTCSRFVVCSLEAQQEGVPSTWVCEESDTPHGPMHLHTFGPFELTENVSGPFGVSCCATDGDAWHDSARILHTMWDAMQRPFASVRAA